MIFNKENVERYFHFMKSKGSIPEEWSYNGFIDDGDHLKIYYLHTTGKRSSYRLPKDIIIKDLRDDKLRKLLD